MSDRLVLVVDDSRTMRDMLRLALTGSGYAVAEAGDGLHGLEVLEGIQPDAIVSDLNMPRLDGFGFIERVRAGERHRSVPILVLTTESDPAKKARARSAGATGWIVKPFDPDKLAAALARVIV